MQAKTRGRRGPTDHSTWEKVVASKLVHAKVLKQVHDISSREVDPVLRPAPVTSTSPSKATRGTTKNEAQVFEAVISQRNAGLVYAKADRDFGWHADRNPVPLRAAPRRGPKVCLPPKMTTKAEAQKWIARMPPHVPPHTARYEFSMGGREVAGAMVFAEGGESPRRADRMTTREEADALAATVDAVRHTPVDSKSARYKFSFTSPSMTEVMVGPALDEQRAAERDENPAYYYDVETSASRAKPPEYHPESKHYYPSRETVSQWTLDTMACPPPVRPPPTPIATNSTSRWAGKQRYGDSGTVGALPARTMHAKQMSSTFALG